MLKELYIKNFAIIDDLRIEFEGGFNVLTGETGAGKSIIVDALGLILGGRAHTNLIKTDRDEAALEAFFDFEDRSMTERLGIETDDGIIIKRIVTTSGKNRAYINNSMVNLQSLLTLGNSLVDIHSQHEHQSLLSKEKQMAMCDSFGDMVEELKDYSKKLNRYKSLSDEKKRLLEKAKERDHRIDLLRFQTSEIESASLSQNEMGTLLREQKILSNLTTLRELSEDSYSQLHSMEGSASDRFAAVAASLSQLSVIDSEASEISKIAENIQSLIKELTLLLREYKDNIELSPERLDEVENRIELIKKLERKYGEGYEAIQKYKRDASIELDSLINAEENLNSIQEEIVTLERELNYIALNISEKRKKTAASLKKDINDILKELAFKKALFNIELSQNRNEDGSLRFLSSGIDSGLFLFSANPGEPAKPLQKVASGGELSRVMLALKAKFAEFDEIPVLVFDEVDAGIGGETADIVGDKLKKLSQKHQVICISHLPQIVSKADNHLNVTKIVMDNSVKIFVKKLSQKERENELARMLSGNITDISLKHARELLDKNG